MDAVLDTRVRSAGLRLPARRRWAAAVSVAILPVAAASTASAVPVRYSIPVPQQGIATGFDADALPYGPGHRGVDLNAGPGAPVRAAADGTVSFAGPVADRGIVVVQHVDGIRTTYEPVEPIVAVGAIVRRGQVIGSVAGEHGGRTDVLHWGARRGDVYVDPMRLVRPLGVVRLAPRR